MLSPTYSAAAEAPALLRSRGYAVLSPQGVCELARCELAQLRALEPSWDDLPADAYLKDGGRYRRRRRPARRAQFLFSQAGIARFSRAAVSFDRSEWSSAGASLIRRPASSNRVEEDD